MLHHSELRDLRSKVTHIENKYKYKYIYIYIHIHDTKRYHDATNKGSLCWIQRKYKIYTKIFIRVMF